MEPPGQPPPPNGNSQRTVASYPPRYWWTKRLFVASLVLLLAVAAVWAGWRRAARRRLDRALAAVEARGESVRVADFQGPPLPDAENAAAYFNQAMAAIVQGVDSPASSSLEYEDYPPFPPAWHQMADANVAAHGRVFALGRQARPHARADWGLPTDPKRLRDMLTPLNKARHLANLTGDAALHQHLRGDDAAALELVRDVRHLARAIDQPPLYVYHLVAVGLDSIAFHDLLLINSGLTVAPDDESVPGDPAALLPSTRPSRRGAGRAQVRALIAELLADGEATEPLRRSLLGEQALALDLFREVSRDTRAVGPMFDLDLARLASELPPVTRAATQPTWPGVQAALLQQPPAPPRRARPRGAAAKPPTPLHREAVDFPRVLSDAYVVPGQWLVIQQDMRLRAERRKAAVALAAQLYRADHGGAWPASIQQLVPQYLPVAPLDPYATDGRAIGYRVFPAARPDGADRPVVYDVSEDGKDHLAAQPGWLGAAPNFGWVRGAADQWRDLTRWVPPAGATAVTTQPVPATQPGG